MKDIQNGCYDICTTCFVGGNCCSSFDRINAPVLNKQELNLTEITRLNIDNNIKYINVVSKDEIEIIKKNGSDK